MKKISAVVTPTITTSDPHEYREQMGKIAQISEGVHLDFSDGVFTPTELLPIEEAWRDDNLITHAHIMHQKPAVVIDDIINLEADLVILHIESDNLKDCLITLQENGTRTGVALLPESSVQDLVESDIDGLFDHVLVFGGHLGYQGGVADLSQLSKVADIKKTYPDVEIAWDGGVNDTNARQIADSGVDVLNVGGFIKDSDNPKKAYDTLSSLVQS